MTHHLANRSQFPQLLNANRNGHVPDNKHQYLPQFPNHRKRLRHFRRRTTLSLEYIPTITNILFTLFRVQIMFNMFCFKFLLHVSLGWKLNFSFNLYIWDHSHIVRNGQNRKWHGDLDKSHRSFAPCANVELAAFSLVHPILYRSTILLCWVFSLPFPQHSCTFPLGWNIKAVFNSSIII